MSNVRLHTIHCPDDKYLLYLPDTFKFFKASENTVKLAELICAGKSYAEVNEIIFDLEESIYDSMCATLRSDANIYTGSNSSVRAYEDWSRYLPRLVLNISNDCNFRCKYCYANGGNYSSARAIMSEDIALKTLDFFFSHFQKIDVIHLFGGEPLMNIAVIELVAKYIEKHCKDTKIGLITNGSLINDEVAALVSNYNISITLSIDHREMQDTLRPFANNNGTYHKIWENVQLLRKRSSQPSQLEVVYTQEHVERGISITETMKQLQSDFGKIPIHLTRVCSDDLKYKLKNADSFIDSIDVIFADQQLNAESDYSFSSRIISALRSKRIQTNFCYAGFGTISVSTEGDIYPCFIFTDNIDFKITNINEPLPCVIKSVDDMRKKYFENSKFSTQARHCDTCFANTICFGCLGMNYSETGDPYNASEIQCEIIKGGLERVLKNLAYGG